MTEGNYNYPGEDFTKHIIFESLCCTPETNIMSTILKILKKEQQSCEEGVITIILRCKNSFRKVKSTKKETGKGKMNYIHS